MDLTPRAVIAGRYRVDTKVGAGGMGEVWLGEQLGVGVRVAVKTLLPAAAMNHEVVARFKREAFILGRIRSDHVARVVDFVADDLYGLVLVMEFVEGDPLSRVLQERTLSVEEGLDLALGLALALKDLHGANIIHRDLKPGNVMMRPLPDGRRRAVVVDFGVSRLMADKDKDEDEELTGITRADMAVGTIEYMAPEQILNSRNVAPGSDVYAVGAMLFRACAGRHVFGNVQSDTELAQKKLTTEAPALPLQRTDPLAEGFAKVVAKMVKRRPSERYKTADEVLQDLLPLKALANPPPEPDTATLTLKGVHAAQIAQAAQPQAHHAQGMHAQAPSNQSGAYQAVSAPMHADSNPSGTLRGALASIPHAPPQAYAQPAPQPSPQQTPAQPVSAPVQSPSSPSRDSLRLAGAATPPPTRVGVPVVVTVVLVAAALGGGVVIGPRLLSPNGFGPSAAASATATASTTPATAATPSTPSTASSAPAAASATAVATLPETDRSADAGGTAVDAGAADAGPAGRDGGGSPVRPVPATPAGLH